MKAFRSPLPVSAAAVAIAALLAGPFRSAPSYAAGERLVRGELVVLDGSPNRFRLVDHDGVSFVAPTGTSLEPLDGKPVSVELDSSGRVIAITEIPMEIK